MNALDAGLGYAMGAGIDYADLYFQRTWQEGWVLEDGEVKEEGSFNELIKRKSHFYELYNQDSMTTLPG